MILQLIITIILLSLLPTALISLFIYIKYNRNEIDKSIFFRMVIFGAISVIPAAFIVSFTTKYSGNNLISKYLVKPFLAIAFIEELIKFLILRFLLYRNNKFTSKGDGIIYSIAISIGFAFFENIIYLTGTGDPVSLLISRSLTTVPLHALCGAFMGYYVGLSKEKENNKMRRGLFSAVLIHGFYNLIITLPFPFNLLSIVFIIISILILRQLYVKNSQTNRF
ncbi:MAG: PrsW family intramembrane metalloprotease [bacterium]|nr:PrsW family intramembrane metalloprotease [bacterium]